MPKLKKSTKRQRAQILTNLNKKHRGNQTEIAEELGITRSAVNHRFHNSSVGQTAQEIIQNQIEQEAKKQGISIRWYLRKLKKGANDASKITGYLNNKVDGVDKVSDEFVDTPDWSVQHKYLVTLGELLKYLKRNGDIKVIAQAIVGAEIADKIKEMETGQIKSDI